MPSWNDSPRKIPTNHISLRAALTVWTCYLELEGATFTELVVKKIWDDLTLLYCFVVQEVLATTDEYRDTFHICVTFGNPPEPTHVLRSLRGILDSFNDELPFFGVYDALSYGLLKRLPWHASLDKVDAMLARIRQNAPEMRKLASTGQDLYIVTNN